MSAPITSAGGPVERAATVLEAVARHCDAAADPDVPIRCGRAADRLRGRAAPAVPVISDDPTAVSAALSEADALLRSLPEADLSDAVLDALADIRAAAALVGPH